MFWPNQAAQRRGTAKKGVAVATEAPAPARGKFFDDVVEALKGGYNVELTTGEFKSKSESHLGRVNDYKHKLLISRPSSLTFTSTRNQAVSMRWR